MSRFTRFSRGKIWFVNIGPCKRFDIFQLCLQLTQICEFYSEVGHIMGVYGLFQVIFCRSGVALYCLRISSSASMTCCFLLPNDLLCFAPIFFSTLNGYVVELNRAKIRFLIEFIDKYHG